MPETGSPADQGSRDRIANDLGSTLFVEAGAGSGKTWALVGRVLALVTSGRAELASIAAVTFTDKAAAELRDRIRRGLEREIQREGDPEVGLRCQTALGQLDGAAIGTLHAFAQRLLSEHPVEAGLPPRVEVLDEVSSDVEFERRWGIFRDELLTDAALERSILLLVASGVKITALHSLAVTFNDNWDLVEERVAAEAAEPPPVEGLLNPVLASIDTVCAEPCRDPNDKLGTRLQEIGDYVSRLRAIHDEADLLEALDPYAEGRPRFKVGNLGRRTSFADIADLRERVRQAGASLDAARQEVAQACAHRLGATIRRFTLEAAGERRRAGQLEFHDLLVLARALLRDKEHGPAVRARLHERYNHVLLDEVQDTDPIQIELAVRIAAADPGSSSSGEAPWQDVPVSPGHLFFVGDPKQSIYRFRRADISTFLAASERFGEHGGLVELTTNFRTTAPVIDWVNSTFAPLMDERGEIELPVQSQPRYRPLDPVRPRPSVGPPVAVIGRDEHSTNTSADDLRAAEAEDVAAVVTRAIHEGWRVDDPSDGWKPARLGDITILVPARTSLPFLEDALDRAGIAYRADSSSLVYASRAVRDLLMVLRAVDDPTNHLHVVSALRTPLLGCGDDDLFRFRWECKGRWSYLGDQPNTVPPEDPVRVGLTYLRSLFEQRQWLAPSELLGRIARDRRALELGFAEGRPRDVWRRLRFVVDQARAWIEATGGNLRQYLDWVDRQTGEGARVAEAILPETDDDAVRIMTIHSAKGLEFPITILSGMSTVPRGQPAPAQVVFPATGGVGYKFGSDVVTSEYEAWMPIDEQMGLHERIRLLYVACTRARDHLVVSLHRKQRKADAGKAQRTNAELLLSGMGALLETLPDGVEPIGQLPPIVAPQPLALLPFDSWATERNRALTRAGRPTTVSATALTEDGRADAEAEPDPGLQKRPRDLDLPPWLKGRYGSAVGRAVHGVLQTIDLATGEGLGAAVAAQCEAEAVSDVAGHVRRLASDALVAPSVKEAAANPHWREVYVCAPIEDRLLEGYIDLLYRTPDGLKVVDYKTAATSDPDELKLRVGNYRMQGGSYALAVETTTDESVACVTFVFLTPEGAVEMQLPQVRETIAEICRAISARAEMEVLQ